MCQEECPEVLVRSFAVEVRRGMHIGRASTGFDVILSMSAVDILVFFLGLHPSYLSNRCECVGDRLRRYIYCVLGPPHRELVN